MMLCDLLRGIELTRSRLARRAVMAPAWVCRCNGLRKWAQRRRQKIGWYIGQRLSRRWWHIRETHLGRILRHCWLQYGLHRDRQVIQSPPFSKHACLAILTICLSVSQMVSLRIAGNLVCEVPVAWFGCHCDDCRLARKTEVGTDVVDAVNRVKGSRSTWIFIVGRKGGRSGQG